MAKRKTQKKEKVIDLTPKPEKITKEHLKELQEKINNLNRLQLEIGMVESQKHTVLHTVAIVKDQLTIMQNKFKEEYGTYDIDIQDGKINYPENGEADKKD